MTEIGQLFENNLRMYIAGQAGARWEVESTSIKQDTKYNERLAEIEKKVDWLVNCVCRIYNVEPETYFPSQVSDKAGDAVSKYDNYVTLKTRNGYWDMPAKYIKKARKETGLYALTEEGVKGYNEYTVQLDKDLILEEFTAKLPESLAAFIYIKAARDLDERYPFQFIGEELTELGRRKVDLIERTRKFVFTAKFRVFFDEDETTLTHLPVCEIIGRKRISNIENIADGLLSCHGVDFIIGDNLFHYDSLYSNKFPSYKLDAELDAEPGVMIYLEAQRDEIPMLQEHDFMYDRRLVRITTLKVEKVLDGYWELSHSPYYSDDAETTTACIGRAIFEHIKGSPKYKGVLEVNEEDFLKALQVDFDCDDRKGWIFTVLKDLRIRLNGRERFVKYALLDIRQIKDYLAQKGLTIESTYEFVDEGLDKPTKYLNGGKIVPIGETDSSGVVPAAPTF